MKKVLVLLLVVMSGCVNLDKKAVATNLDGGFFWVNPASGEVMMGEGTINWIDAPTKSGQGFKYHSVQYGLGSTNVWFDSTFQVEASIDGTAQIETAPVPFFTLGPLKMFDPWSPVVTTIRYIPSESQNMPVSSTNEAARPKL